MGGLHVRLPVQGLQFQFQAPQVFQIDFEMRSQGC